VYVFTPFQIKYRYIEDEEAVLQVAIRPLQPVVASVSS
jgi:hypothetical protein